MNPSIYDSKLARTKNLVREDLVGLADVSLLALLLLLFLLLPLGRCDCD